jgi:hypothetical protein
VSDSAGPLVNQGVESFQEGKSKDCMVGLLLVQPCRTANF